MSNFSLGDNNAQSIAIQKARQIAAKLQLAAPNKRPNEDDDNEPRAKRFSSGSDSSMSPANLQQAQQAAAQLAARFSQPNYQQNVQPNLEAVERAKLLINKFVPQGAGGSPNFDQQGGGNGPARPGFGANTCTEMMIPGSKVGLIIGKGGLTIKQLQERTGAKMVIIQDGPNQEMEKLLKISGDPQKVDHAKQLVYELLQEKGNDQQNRNQNQRGMQDHGGNYSNFGRGNDGGGDQFEIVIPKVAVGVVIGKEGSMIKKIQSDTGCSMKILQTKGDEPGDRICTIQGSKQQVDDGKIMIEELIDSVLRRNNEGGGGRGGGGNDNWSNNRSGGSNFQQQHHQQNQSSSMGGGIQVQQYEFTVPSNKCGIIIGRGGDTIKQINQQSGAHCEMDRNKSANQMDEKTFSIKGDQHQVEEAKRLIQDKINMDVELQYVGTATMNQPANKFNSQNPQSQWGAAAGGYNQGQAAGQMPGQQGAQAGQSADYSLHWIQYYRSMGMHQQADAIEAQMKAQAQSAPANPPQPQAPAAAAGGGQDSQGDYRREWAAYYRQIGQVAEAEAIERQIKSGPGNGNPLSFQPGAAANMQKQQQQPQQQQYGQQYGSNYPQQYQ